MGNAGIPFLAINALTNLLFQMELRRHHSHSSTSTGNGMSTALWGTQSSHRSRIPVAPSYLWKGQKCACSLEQDHTDVSGHPLIYFYLEKSRNQQPLDWDALRAAAKHEQTTRRGNHGWERSSPGLGKGLEFHGPREAAEKCPSGLAHGSLDPEEQRAV